eukprot:gene11634-34343_t
MKLWVTQEAKALGLIDDVVSKDALLSSAETVMQSLVKLPNAAFATTKRLLMENFASDLFWETHLLGLVKLPNAAFATTKRSLRESFASDWEKYYVLEPIGAWKMLASSETVHMLDGVLQRLAGKPSPKPKL